MNIILIVLDTVRKDYITPYGGQGFPTAALERFSEEAVLYNNVISPAPWTTPVHASIFTGMYPSRHGTHGGNLIFNSSGSPTLMTLLKARGYRCAGISTNYLISEQFGFADDFDLFLQAWQAVPQKYLDYHFSRDAFIKASRKRKAATIALDLLSPGRSLNAARSIANKWYGDRNFVINDATFSTLRAMQWGKKILRSAEDLPTFLFVNLMQAHDKYNPPDEIREELGLGHDLFDIDTWGYFAGKEELDEEAFECFSRLYAGEVFFLDRCLADFFRFMRGQGMWDDSMVVLLSDHGELIGEHGLLGHMAGLFRELIDIPMMIKYPNGVMAGREDSKLRQSHDVFAAILDLIGSETPRTDDAVSLLEMDGRKRAISQLTSNNFMMDEIEKEGGDLRQELVQYARPMMAVIQDNLKYVESSGGNKWLFERTSDPAEERNLVGASAWVSTLQQCREMMRDEIELTRFTPSVDSPQMEEETVQRLKAMGYL